MKNEYAIRKDMMTLILKPAFWTNEINPSYINTFKNIHLIELLD